MTTTTTTTTTTTSAGTCLYCTGELPPRKGAGPKRTTCDECKREQARARGKRSYDTWREANPLPVRERKLKHKPGDRFGSLVLTEREEGPLWGTFLCDCGRSKRLRVPNVTKGYTSDCADRTVHPDPRLVERPTYSTAHQRVRAERGSASEHDCRRCEGKAEQWALDHGDVDQLAEVGGREREEGMTYSAKPRHYFPLCRTCHQTWDAGRAKAAPKHALSLAHVVLHAALYGCED